MAVAGRSTAAALLLLTQPDHATDSSAPDAAADTTATAAAAAAAAPTPSALLSTPSSAAQRRRSGRSPLAAGASAAALVGSSSSPSSSSLESPSPKPASQQRSRPRSGGAALLSTFAPPASVSSAAGNDVSSPGSMLRHSSVPRSTHLAELFASTRLGSSGTGGGAFGSARRNRTELFSAGGRGGSPSAAGTPVPGTPPAPGGGRSVAFEDPLPTGGSPGATARRARRQGPSGSMSVALLESRQKRASKAETALALAQRGPGTSRAAAAGPGAVAAGRIESITVTVARVRSASRRVPRNVSTALEAPVGSQGARALRLERQQRAAATAASSRQAKQGGAVTAGSSKRLVRQLRLSRHTTLGELRERLEMLFDVEIGLQRLLVKGRELVGDDKRLTSLGIGDGGQISLHCRSMTLRVSIPLKDKPLIIRGLDSSVSVHELKTEIEAATGIPAHQQRLAFLEDKDLPDAKSLYKCGVVEHSNLRVHLWPEWAPLYTALKAGNHQRVIELLAGPPALEEIGWATLFLAAFDGLESLCRSLVRLGCNAGLAAARSVYPQGPLPLGAPVHGFPHVSRGTGRTPLHAAAMRGHFGCVKIFVEAGDAFYMEDHAGVTPEDLGKESSRAECDYLGMVRWERRLEQERRISKRLIELGREEALKKKKKAEAEKAEKLQAKKQRQENLDALARKTVQGRQRAGRTETAAGLAGRSSNGSQRSGGGLGHYRPPRASTDRTALFPGYQSVSI